jgi:GDP-L-fucose synthase
MRFLREPSLIDGGRLTSNYWHNRSVLVTGGHGFLGSFLTDQLMERGLRREHIRIPRSKEMDLRRWENCVKAVEGIDTVIHLAANVGGIGYNRMYPGTLFFENAIMGVQLMEAARLEGVAKFVALGTVCAYPKYAPVPFREDNLWDGYPEETNAPYGIAKKTLLVQAQSYRAQFDFNAIYLLPVNLYGPRDNFDPGRSHVIPALIRKMVDAKARGDNEVEVWGTGEASREFLYVEDAAEAIVLATERYNEADPINIGAGSEVKIKDLVSLISKLTGFGGKIRWNKAMPDGQPRRMLDTSKAETKFGFRAKTSLEEGLRKTIEWYKNAATDSTSSV